MEQKEVIVFLREKRFAATSLDKASKLTGVPIKRIRAIIGLKGKTPSERRNGGHTTPEGWGFDWLA